MPFVALFMVAGLRATLEQPAREILARRLGPLQAKSPDPFADLAQLVRDDARGSTALGGLFGALLGRRSVSAGASAQ